MTESWSRGLAVCAVSLVMLVSASPGAHASWEVSRAYVGANEPYVRAVLEVTARLDGPTKCTPKPAPGLGGACFFIPAGGEVVRIDISDVSGRTMSASVWFPGAGHAESRYICAPETLSIPDDANGVVVAPDVYNTCAGGGVPATAGTIRARFS